MSDHVILNYQDKPIKLFLWTIPTVGWVVSPTVYFMFFGKPLTGLIVSLGIALGIREFKKRFGDGGLIGILYWILPHRPDHMPVTPPSYIREYGA